jgi:Winged helix-turn-helix DNA-binding
MSSRRVKNVYGIPKSSPIVRQDFETKLPEFKVVNGKDYVMYGESNRYPDYLLEMYQRSAKHNAIVNGKVNYITGKGWTYEADKVPSEMLGELNRLMENPNPYDDLNDILYKTALDFEIFNGFALEIVWNMHGKVSQIAHKNFGNLRRNVDGSKFYYADEWKEFGEPEGLTEYMPFDPEKRLGKQLFYYCSYAPSVRYYPIPEYLGALAYIETDARIANYHVNNLRNGFLGGFLFNFNNGVPSDEEQREIKRQLQKQLKGDDGERIVVNFNDSADTGLKIEPLNANDLDKQFNILNETIQQEIFVAHRVTSPMLFGVRVDGQLGGRSELVEAYELFKAVYVNDRVQKLEKVFNYIFSFNGLGVLEIEPTEPITERLTEQSLLQIMTKDELREKAGLPPLAEVTVNEQPQTFTHHDFRKEKEELALFQKFGRDASEFVEVTRRPMRYGFELLEQEFASEYAELDADILKMIEKDPAITSDKLAEKLGKDIQLISDRISALIEAKAINIRGALKELGESAKDFIKPRNPEGEPLVQVMYKYDVLPEFGPQKLIPGSREFCSKMIELGRYYTRQDINQISDIMGYSVWERKGGWYTKPGTNQHYPTCRHTWMQTLVKPKA